MANDCIPLWEPGDRITCVATASVTGKTLVDVSAAPNADGSFNVATCAAGKKPVGVAAYDAPTGAAFTVIACSKTVLAVTAGGTVTQGQEVESDAAGKVITWGGTVATRQVGKAMSAATAGNDCLVQLY